MRRSLESAECPAYRQNVKPLRHAARRGYRNLRAELCAPAQTDVRQLPTGVPRRQPNVGSTQTLGLGVCVRKMRAHCADVAKWQTQRT